MRIDSYGLLRLFAILVFWLLIDEIVCFAQSSIAEKGLSQIQASGVLRWGADKEGGGPFVYPSADDPQLLIGFEVDIAAELASRLGLEPQFTQGQWDKLPELLDRGDVDIVLNGYEYSPVRAASYGISIPYYIYELQLLATDGEGSLKSWEELRSPTEKKRIAVLGGSAADDYLKKNYAQQVEVVSFEGATDAMRAVELGIDGLDANLQDLPVWTFFAKGFPGLKPVGEPVAQGYYVILVRKDKPELLKAVNQALLEMLSDGTLRSIYQKYGLWNRAQQLRALEVDSQGQFVGNGGSIQNSDGSQEEGQQTYVPVRGLNVMQQRGGILVRAALMTIVLSVIAMPLAILIGLVASLLRLYGPIWLSIPSSIYVEVVRGTPLVLQLFIIFFLLPDIGISISAFWAAIAGLAINYSAYEAEVYRAGLQAIPKGQMEAAVSLGMSKWMALRRVIIPQASRLVIPPVTNDFIALFKDTAVCSVITVVELSKEYSIQARSTGAVVELGILTALLYLSMSYPLSVVAGMLERRLQKRDEK